MDAMGNGDSKQFQKAQQLALLTKSRVMNSCTNQQNKTTPQPPPKASPYTPKSLKHAHVGH